MYKNVKIVFFSITACTAIVHKGCKESVPPCLKVSLSLKQIVPLSVVYVL